VFLNPGLPTSLSPAKHTSSPQYIQPEIKQNSLLAPDTNVLWIWTQLLGAQVCPPKLSGCLGIPDVVALRFWEADVEELGFGLYFPADFLRDRPNFKSFLYPYHLLAV
jgi:hypothetical protein